MSGTVLVVDDDPYIREALSDLLKDEGYQVLMAREGAEALGLVAQQRPCVIVLDIMMPVMDGLTFLRHLRSSVPHRSIPVVVMTAAPGRVPADLNLPVVAKPIEIHSLLELIRRHCKPVPSASPDRSGPEPADGGTGTSTTKQGAAKHDVADAVH